MSKLKEIAKPKRKAHATKAEAASLTLEVSKTWQQMEKAWFRLGRLVDLCIERCVPQALGMNAHSWMEKYLPGSTAKVWRALRIHRALKGIPEKKLEQLTEGNAYDLSRLPEKERKSEKWVSRAIELPNEKFQEEVSSVLERKGVQREEFVTLRISLPREVYDQVEQCVQKVARICELDIETVPGRRIMIWEYIAGIINGVSEETLFAAIQGSQAQDVEPKTS